MAPISAVDPFAAPFRAPAAAATSPSAASGSSPASKNQLTGNSFIQLLTAQLQAQDPFNPMDPTSFVSQLVQFNQLQQLIDINHTLSTAAGPSQANPSQSASPNSATTSV
jgi:flagellar basal-body rod modification protein FlgD